MYAYIKGTLEIKGTDYIVVETGGIGYKIFAPLTTIDKLGEIGTNVKVFTHHHVREDNISLYGFTTLEELRMFELLIGVSGVGAKSAQRIILELKDKLKSEEAIAADGDFEIQTAIGKDDNIHEAISALQVLGYPVKEATKAVTSFDATGLTIEEIIKKALLYFTKK